MSDEQYRKTVLGFEPSTLAGIDVTSTSEDEEGAVALALMGHPQSSFGAAYGKCVVSNALAGEESTVAFVFSVNSSAKENMKASQIVVGVASTDNASSTRARIEAWRACSSMRCALLTVTVLGARRLHRIPRWPLEDGALLRRAQAGGR